jgi:hypothetical protein
LNGIYNALTTPLTRLGDDLFEATSDDFKGFKVTFIPDKNGFVERAIIDMGERGSAVFTREHQPLPVSKKFMRKCAGKYQLGDKTLKVSVEDAKMTITSAGQPDYVLVSGKGGKFDLKNTPGYSVEFLQDEQEKITGAVVTQPNGSFLLNKVA